MRQYLRDVFLALVTLASLWLVYACSGCAPTTLAQAGTTTPAVTGASVVTLVRPTAQWAWGSLSDGALGTGGYDLRWTPSCNAFAISTSLMVTAAHCVDGVKEGGEVRYLSPDGVGHGIATLLSVNEAADLATCEAHGLTPLTLADPPHAGEAVLSVSSLYRATSYGHMVGRLSTGYYETDQTIIKGWSGSPVLDAQGRAWGVVSRCPEVPETKECEPGATIVTALQ